MDLDAFLSTLSTAQPIEEHQTRSILLKLKESLYDTPTTQPLSAPITVVGDIHGQLFDLLELFRVSGDPSTTNYVFLGDYVDRGRHSLLTFLYLAILKLKHPDTFFLLRGNHECRAINQMYGFYDECVDLSGHAGIWRLCNEVFDLLPIAAVISDKVFCIHGGLSPDIKLIDQIAVIPRQDELPSTGPFSDLTWSDPEDIECWALNQRGAGFLFGRRPTREFCANNKLELICRAHQLAMEGFQYHFEDKQLLTVWSAPNYMYRSGNAATVLKLGDNLEREFVAFHAVPDEQRVIPVEGAPHYFA
jgi:diadenosine tetraphosphatase ApaH/serine/threonine PP2A family protein phosphatase